MTDVALGLSLFAVAVLGACIGSFVNVLAYRLPKGQGIVFPPSGCPSCGTRLTAADNIPVLGWFLLKGRCRYCGDRISFGYPVVEAVTAALFTAWFSVCYLTALRPGMAIPGLDDTSLILLTHFVLLGGLVAASLVDARHFIVPLEIPWTVTAVAVVLLPLTAAVFPWSLLTPTDPGAIAEVYRDAVAVRGRVGGDVILSAMPFDRRPTLLFGGVGAMAGVLVASLLVRLRWLPRSFGGEAAEGPPAGAAGDSTEAAAAEPEAPETEGDEKETETAVHPRREMLKEALFLLFPVVGWVAATSVPIDYDGWPPAAERAAWVLAGVLTGYLTGGAVVWGVRLLGTAWLDKEAMGLGDAHLLAAVGAVGGWEVAVLAFFGAAFVALTYTVLAEGVGRLLRRRVRMIPYGPHIAVATVLVMVFREPIWAYMVAHFVSGPM